MGQKLGTANYKRITEPLLNLSGDALNNIVSTFFSSCESYTLDKDAFIFLINESLLKYAPLILQRYKSGEQYAIELFESMNDNNNNNNNTIEFIEFIVPLSLASTLEIDDTLKFIFDLFDSNNTGQLSMNEMVLSLKESISGLCKFTYSSPPPNHICEHFATNAFYIADEDHDQSINFNDFLKFLKNSSEPRSWIEAYDNTPDPATINLTLESTPSNDDPIKKLIPLSSSDILNEQIISRGRLPKNRSGSTLCECLSNSEWLLLFGGQNENGLCNETFLLNLQSSLCEPIHPLGTLPTPRTEHSAISINISGYNKSMLIFGGIGPKGQRLNDIHLLLCEETNNPLRPSFEWINLTKEDNSPALPIPRSGASLCEIKPGYIVLFGGQTKIIDNNIYLLKINMNNKTFRWDMITIISDQLDIPTSRSNSTFINSKWHNNISFLFGGTSKTSHLNDLYLFHLLDNNNDDNDERNDNNNNNNNNNNNYLGQWLCLSNGEIDLYSPRKREKSSLTIVKGGSKFHPNFGLFLFGGKDKLLDEVLSDGWYFPLPSLRNYHSSLGNKNKKNRTDSFDQLNNLSTESKWIQLIEEGENDLNLKSNSPLLSLCNDLRIISLIPSLSSSNKNILSVCVSIWPNLSWPKENLLLNNKLDTIDEFEESIKNTLPSDDIDDIDDENDIIEEKEDYPIISGKENFLNINNQEDDDDIDDKEIDSKDDQINNDTNNSKDKEDDNDNSKEDDNDNSKEDNKEIDCKDNEDDNDNSKEDNKEIDFKDNEDDTDNTSKEDNKEIDSKDNEDDTDNTSKEDNKEIDSKDNEDDTDNTSKDHDENNNNDNIESKIDSNNNDESDNDDDNTIDDNSTSSNNKLNFLIEEASDGDQFTSIQQWKTQIIEPPNLPEIINTPPPINVKLDWVYGVSTKNMSNHVFYNSAGDIIYPCSSLNVKLHRTKETQEGKWKEVPVFITDIESDEESDDDEYNNNNNNKIIYKEKIWKKYDPDDSDFEDELINEEYNDDISDNISELSNNDELININKKKLENNIIIKSYQTYFREHNDDISCITKSYTSDYFASGELGREPSIYIWNSSTMKPIRLLKGHHQRKIKALSFSNDASSSLIASIGGDNNNTLIIYDWVTGKLEFSSPTINGGNVKSLCWINKNLLLSCGNDHLYLWRSSGNNNFTKRKGIFGKKGGISTQNCIASLETNIYNENNLCKEKFITGNELGQILLWNGRNVIKRIKAHNKSVNTLYCNLSNEIIISGGNDSNIKLFSLDLECISTFNLKKIDNKSIRDWYYYINSITMNNNGTKILLSTYGGSIYEINSNDGKNLNNNGIALIESHSRGELWGLTSHPYRREFATVGDDCMLHIWDEKNKTVLLSKNLKTPARCIQYSPDGKYLAIGHGIKRNTKGIHRLTGIVWILDSWTLDIIISLQDRIQPITDIKFSEDGNILGVSSTDLDIILYNTNDWTIRSICKGNISRILHFDFSIDSNYIMSNSTSNDILYFNTYNGKLLKNPKNELEDVEWLTCTCPFSYPMQGIWSNLNITDSTNINTVDAILPNSKYGMIDLINYYDEYDDDELDEIESKNLIAVGDDNGGITFFSYPALNKSKPSTTFNIHASHVTNVNFAKFDYRMETLLSCGGNDKSIFQWKIQYENLSLDELEGDISDLDNDNEINDENSDDDDNDDDIDNNNNNNNNNDDDDDEIDEEDEAFEYISSRIIMEKQSSRNKKENFNNLIENNLFDDNLFSIEDVDDGDQFTSIQPWKNQITEPTNFIENKNNNNITNNDISINWVYGWNGTLTRQSVLYNNNLDIIYPAAALGVKYKTSSISKQLFFNEHSDDICSLAMHPDKIHIATAQLGKRPIIHIWNSNTLKLISTIKCQPIRGISTMCFSNDGYYLAFIGDDDDHTLYIYSWKEGILRNRIKTGKNYVINLTFSPDDNQIIQCGVKHFIIWEIEGKILKKKKGLFGSEGTIQPILCMNFISRLIEDDDDEEEEFEEFTEEELELIIMDSDDLDSDDEDFNDKNNNINEDDNISLWLGDDNIRYEMIPSILVLGTHDGSIYRVNDRIVESSIQGHDNPIVAMTNWSGGIITGDNKCNIKIWNHSLELISEYNIINSLLSNNINIDELLYKNTLSIRSICIDPNDINLYKKHLLLDNNERILINNNKMKKRTPQERYDEQKKIKSNRIERKIERRKQLISNKLLIGTRGGAIIELRAYDGANLHGYPLTQSHGRGEIWGLSSHPIHDEFATVGDDAILRIWNAKMNKLIHIINLFCPGRCCSYSNDGTRIVVGLGKSGKDSGDKSGHVQVYRTDNWELEWEGNVSSNWISEVRFSTNNKYLAVASHDQKVSIYKITKQEKKIELENNDDIETNEENKDNDNDNDNDNDKIENKDNNELNNNIKKNIKIHIDWDYLRVYHLDEFHSSVNHLDFSDDGNKLRCNTLDYEILYFDLETGKLINQPFSYRDINWITSTCTFSWCTKSIYDALNITDGTDINSVDKTNDNKIIAVGDDFGKVHLFNYPCVGNEPIPKTRIGHSSHVTNVRWIGKNNDYLVSLGGNDKCIIQWNHIKDEINNNDNNNINNDNNNNNNINDTIINNKHINVYYNTSGSIIYNSLTYGSIYDRIECKHIKLEEYDNNNNNIINQITSLTLSDDGTLIITSHIDNNIYIWDAYYGSKINSIDLLFKNKLIQHISISSNKQYIMIICNDKYHTVLLYNSPSGEWLNDIRKKDMTKNTTNNINFICSNNNINDYLFITGGNSNITFWSMNGQNIASYQGLGELNDKNVIKNNIFTCGYANSRELITGTNSGLLCQWRGRSIHKKVQSHDNSITCINSTSLNIITASIDGNIKIWNNDLIALNGYSVHSNLFSIKPNSICIKSIQFHPNPSIPLILVAFEEGEVYEISIDTSYPSLVFNINNQEL